MPARRGGGGGPIKQVAGFLLAAMVGVAILQGMPSEPTAFMADLRAKSVKFEDTVNRLVDAVGLTKDGSIPDPKIPNPAPPGGAPGAPGAPAPAAPAPAAPAAPAAAPAPAAPAGNGALDALKVAPAQKVNYNRDEWRHWDNVTRCWTVREEVLYRDAVPGTINMVDRDKRRTTSKADACEVVGGEWIDPFTGQKFTNPADIDIDHVVALGEAAKSGGQGWDGNKKRDFANHLGYNHHLLAVSASANRQKGDKTPAAWKPSNKAYWCTYANDWIAIKGKWQLTVTQDEKKHLAEMLRTC